TPRERVVLDPGDSCPDCGGPLRLVGEDSAEILELVAAKMNGIDPQAWLADMLARNAHHESRID
ncbi:hypothetical protein DRB17_19820, partial [Ferruginivarius sediminum]